MLRSKIRLSNVHLLGVSLIVIIQDSFVPQNRIPSRGGGGIHAVQGKAECFTLGYSLVSSRRNSRDGVVTGDFRVGLPIIASSGVASKRLEVKLF